MGEHNRTGQEMSRHRMKVLREKAEWDIWGKDKCDPRTESKGRRGEEGSGGQERAGMQAPWAAYGFVAAP